MNRASLEKLAGLKSENALREGVEELCAPFGGAKEVHIFLDETTKSYTCVVDLKSSTQEMALLFALGGHKFDDSIVFTIPAEL